MSTLDTILDSSLYSELSADSKFTSGSSSGSQLSQADFLSLITTQLQYQDPFEPADNVELTSQMAQLATVSSLEELNTNLGEGLESLGATLSGYLEGIQDSLDTLAGLSGMRLQTGVNEASSYLNHWVYVAGDQGMLFEDEPLSGGVEVPEGAGQVTIAIQDADGNPITELTLEPGGAGLLEFQWDGVGDDGERAEAGVYGVSATVTTADGEEQAADTYVAGYVESVSLNGSAGGAMLNLAGLGQIDPEEVVLLF